ncbi:MAG: metal transporter CNNM [Candidatus Woesearchaeota archaeon]|jgi:metal transporter CNNM
MIIQYIIILLTLTLSAAFSGLTLGLMGLNTHELKRKATLGNHNAIALYPIRLKGNLLLCTLLVGNVAVNSTLALFLGSIAGGLAAGLIATSLIVIFGEILPQALFSRYALAMGAKLSWLVHFFIVLLYPICKPIAMGLDKLLGAELPTRYSKRELNMIIKEQGQLNQIHKGSLDIIEGGLHFSEKFVEDVMTPLSRTFMVHANFALNKKKINEIDELRYSRVPVYEDDRQDIIGLLFAKDLVCLSHHDKKRVKQVMRPSTISVNRHAKLPALLNLFKRQRTHLFLVVDDEDVVLGIVTLEDVLEEIVGDIRDEHD